MKEFQTATESQIREEIDLVLAECKYDEENADKWRRAYPDGGPDDLPSPLDIYRSTVTALLLELAPSLFLLKKTGEMLRETYKIAPSPAMWREAMEHLLKMAADGYTYGY